jgi:hypothetical protein
MMTSSSSSYVQPTYSEAIPTEPGYYVYRFWAADETCLYVGRVGDSGPRPPQARLNYHRRNKAWWPDVARIEIAELPDHPAVVAEESRQIQALNPAHNIRRGSCTHDLSLPGTVTASGHCATCHRENEKRKYWTQDGAGARLARKRASERRRAVGQGYLWE